MPHDQESPPTHKYSVKKVNDPRLKSSFYISPPSCVKARRQRHRDEKTKDKVSKKRKFEETDEYKENHPRHGKKLRLVGRSRFISRNSEFIERKAKRIPDAVSTCNSDIDDLELYVSARKMCLNRKIIALGIDVIVATEVEELDDTAAPWRTGIVNVIRYSIEKKFQAEPKEKFQKGECGLDEDACVAWSAAVGRIVRRNRGSLNKKTKSSKVLNSRPSFVINPLTRSCLGDDDIDIESSDDIRLSLTREILRTLDTLPWTVYSKEREVGSKDFNVLCRLAERVRRFVSELFPNDNSTFLNQENVNASEHRLNIDRQPISVPEPTDLLSTNRIFLQSGTDNDILPDLSNRTLLDDADDGSVYDTEDMSCSPLPTNSPVRFDTKGIKGVCAIDEPDLFDLSSILEITDSFPPLDNSDPTTVQEEFVKAFEEDPGELDKSSSLKESEEDLENSLKNSSFHALKVSSDLEPPPPPTISRTEFVKALKNKSDGPSGPFMQVPFSTYKRSTSSEKSASALKTSDRYQVHRPKRSKPAEYLEWKVIPIEFSGKNCTTPDADNVVHGKHTVSHSSSGRVNLLPLPKRPRIDILKREKPARKRKTKAPHDKLASAKNPVKKVPIMEPHEVLAFPPVPLSGLSLSVLQSSTSCAEKASENFHSHLHDSVENIPSHLIHAAESGLQTSSNSTDGLMPSAIAISPAGEILAAPASLANQVTSAIECQQEILPSPLDELIKKVPSDLLSFSSHMSDPVTLNISKLNNMEESNNVGVPRDSATLLNHSPVADSRLHDIEIVKPTPKCVQSSSLPVTSFHFDESHQESVAEKACDFPALNDSVIKVQEDNKGESSLVTIVSVQNECQPVELSHNSFPSFSPGSATAYSATVPAQHSSRPEVVISGPEDVNVRKSYNISTETDTTLGASETPIILTATFGIQDLKASLADELTNNIAPPCARQLFFDTALPASVADISQTVESSELVVTSGVKTSSLNNIVSESSLDAPYLLPFSSIRTESAGDESFSKHETGSFDEVADRLVSTVSDQTREHCVSDSAIKESVSYPSTDFDAPLLQSASPTCALTLDDSISDNTMEAMQNVDIPAEGVLTSSDCANKVLPKALHLPSVPETAFKQNLSHLSHFTASNSVDSRTACNETPVAHDSILPELETSLSEDLFNKLLENLLSPPPLPSEKRNSERSGSGQNSDKLETVIQQVSDSSYLDEDIQEDKLVSGVGCYQSKDQTVPPCLLPEIFAFENHDGNVTDLASSFFQTKNELDHPKYSSSPKQIHTALVTEEVVNDATLNKTMQNLAVSTTSLIDSSVKKMHKIKEKRRSARLDLQKTRFRIAKTYCEEVAKKSKTKVMPKVPAVDEDKKLSGEYGKWTVVLKRCDHLLKSNEKYQSGVSCKSGQLSKYHETYKGLDKFIEFCEKSKKVGKLKHLNIKEKLVEGIMKTSPNLATSSNIKKSSPNESLTKKHAKQKKICHEKGSKQIREQKLKSRKKDSSKVNESSKANKSKNSVDEDLALNDELRDVSKKHDSNKLKEPHKGLMLMNASFEDAITEMDSLYEKSKYPTASTTIDKSAKPVNKNVDMHVSMPEAPIKCGKTTSSMATEPSECFKLVDNNAPKANIQIGGKKGNFPSKIKMLVTPTKLPNPTTIPSSQKNKPSCQRNAKFISPGTSERAGLQQDLSPCKIKKSAKSAKPLISSSLKGKTQSVVGKSTSSQKSVTPGTVQKDKSPGKIKKSASSTTPLCPSLLTDKPASMVGKSVSSAKLISPGISPNVPKDESPGCANATEPLHQNSPSPTEADKSVNISNLKGSLDKAPCQTKESLNTKLICSSAKNVQDIEATKGNIKSLNTECDETEILLNRIHASSDVPPLEKNNVPREFHSKDPEENADNNDPEWEELQKVSTDVERYRKVRGRWRNLAIPDPNKDLTYRHRLASLSPKPSENVEKPAKRHNRSRSCTSVYEEIIKKTHDEFNQRMAKITNIQKNEEAMIYLKNGTWDRSMNREIERLQSRHLQRRRELSGEVERTVRRYEEYISEARVFQKFYQGLDSNEDKTLLTAEQEELLDESENMYNAFDEIYDKS